MPITPLRGQNCMPVHSLDGSDALSFGRVVPWHGADFQFLLAFHNDHHLEGDGAAQEVESIVGTARFCSRDSTKVLGSNLNS